MKRYCLLALLSFGVFLLTGCSGLSEQTQPAVSPEIRLEAGRCAGQTFVAHHAGLSGIEFWLSPGSNSTGQIVLHLWDDPQAAQDILTATLPLSKVVAPAFYRFSFSPLGDSHSHYYYAWLETPAEIQIGAGPAEAYLDGAAYQDHQPLDRQLAFRLGYDVRWLLIDAGRLLISGLAWALMVGLLYVVPGWALTLWWWPPGQLDWAERLGVAIGLSLALYPLLVLWTSMIGLHLGPAYAWLPAVGGLLVIIWRYRVWSWRWRDCGSLWRRLCTSSIWSDVALIVTVALVAVGRFIVVRSLDMPLWDDSVQHTVIVQRILEAGGLFQSWEPYAPYQTFSFQFGFHVHAAVWAWLTGMTAPQSVIWAGQAISWLAALTLYPLAFRIRGAWAGCLAVLYAGLFSMFPAYYTNWGRYPQMSGQAILPIAAWWLWGTWPGDRAPTRTSVLGGAGVIAGMVLTYYRMAFHYLSFVLAVLLVTRPTIPTCKHKWFLPLLGIMLAVALALPWLYNLPMPAQLVPVMQESDAEMNLSSFLSQFRVEWTALEATLVFLGTLLAAWIGGSAALPVVWLWLLVALPVLRTLPVPGAQIIQEFTISTSMYIPQALIVGVLGGYTIEKIAERRWLSAIPLVVVIGLGLWKLPTQLTLIDRGYDLSTRPDMRAARWIEASLPQDAFLLINGLLYENGETVVGGDAGWWLPLLSKRGVVIPPEYALVVEQPAEPGYSQAVHQLVQTLFETPPASPQGLEAICRFPRPITHVYLGQQRGLVIKAFPVPPTFKPMLPADVLLESPAFHLIYHQDRVMIFEFRRDLCP